MFSWFHATAAPSQTQLPIEVTMNKEAGRGGLLFVSLRLEDGEELPFLLDTGASGIALDKSLEPKLGNRLGTEPSHGWGGKGKADTFVAPKLFLGGMPLITGSKVWIINLNRPSGILGMDCLKHYCIQFDFQAGKLRFLNPDELNTNQLGNAYPLTLNGNLPFIHHSGLLGGSNTNLLIDMGCHIDGLAEKNTVNGLGYFLPECEWDSETYSNLSVAAVGNANVLGLDFLARHLVTLDFPNRMMYLKQTSINPLGDDDSTKFGNDEMEAPVKFLEILKESGKLPGLSKDGKAVIRLESYSNFDSQPKDSRSLAYVKGYFNSIHKTVTFGLLNEGEDFLCHYTISRASKDDVWKLERAWRTKLNGKKIEEFPVP
jgi:Aspartyl protease